MRYAIVENKIVVRTIIADQDFIDEFYPDAIECDDEVNIGHVYDKKKFTAPPPNFAKIDETLAE